MEPAQVREFLNKYLLERDLERAFVLGYKDLIVYTFKSIKSIENPEEEFLLSNLADAKSSLSRLARSKEKDSEYPREVFEIISTLYDHWRVAIKYTIDNFDNIESERFKKGWLKEHLEEIIKTIDSSIKLYGIQINALGKFIVPKLHFESMEDFFNWGFQILLGDERMAVFINKFNSNLKEYNKYKNQIKLLNDKPSEFN